MQNKTEYSKPRLEKYGSVRNLTGGSDGQFGDGSGTMQSTSNGDGMM